MIYALSLILIGWSLLRFSQEYRSEMDAQFELVVAQGGFYRAEDVAIYPRNLQRATKASIRLAPGGSCSAVYLSDDGRVATALQCIEECLSESWGYKPDIEVNPWLK